MKVSDKWHPEHFWFNVNEFNPLRLYRYRFLSYLALAKDHLTPKIFHKTILRLQDIRHASQAVQENIEPGW